MKIEIDFASALEPLPMAPEGWWPARIESGTIGRSSNGEILLARFSIAFQDHRPMFLFFNLDRRSGVWAVEDLVRKMGHQINPKSAQDSISPLVGEECYALVSMHKYWLGPHKGTIRPVVRQIRAALGEQGEVWDAFQRINSE